MNRLHSGIPLRTCAAGVFLMLLVLGGTQPAAAGRLLGSQLSPLQGTIAADLDGDRRTDMATAGISRRDSHGYLQEITLRFSSSEWKTVTVHTSRLAHRLTARDLDGDANRDLILESFDREPLAVLLNDGEGHFQLADMERFRSRLRRQGSPSMEGRAVESRLDEIGQGPANPTAAPASAGYRHSLTSARLSTCDLARGIPSFYSHAASRGPPAFRN